MPWFRDTLQTEATTLWKNLQKGASWDKQPLDAKTHEEMRRREAAISALQRLSKRKGRLNKEEFVALRAAVVPLMEKEKIAQLQTLAAGKISEENAKKTHSSFLAIHRQFQTSHYQVADIRFSLWNFLVRILYPLVHSSSAGPLPISTPELPPEPLDPNALLHYEINQLKKPIKPALLKLTENEKALLDFYRKFFLVICSVTSNRRVKLVERAPIEYGRKAPSNPQNLVVDPDHYVTKDFPARSTSSAAPVSTNVAAAPAVAVVSDSAAAPAATNAMPTQPATTPRKMSSPLTLTTADQSGHPAPTSPVAKVSPAPPQTPASPAASIAGYPSLDVTPVKVVCPASAPATVVLPRTPHRPPISPPADNFALPKSAADVTPTAHVKTDNLLFSAAHTEHAGFFSPAARTVVPPPRNKLTADEVILIIGKYQYANSCSSKESKDFINYLKTTSDSDEEKYIKAAAYAEKNKGKILSRIIEKVLRIGRYKPIDVVLAAPLMFTPIKREAVVSVRTTITSEEIGSIIRKYREAKSRSSGDSKALITYLEQTKDHDAAYQKLASYATARESRSRALSIIIQKTLGIDPKPPRVAKQLTFRT